MNEPATTLKIGAIFILVVSLTTCGLAAPQRKPNLVLILADDLGYGDLGCFGSGAARTPHLDRLAARGARVTDFYVNAPVCSPSRASLLTGRGPQRHGLTNVIETIGHTAHRTQPFFLFVSFTAPHTAIDERNRFSQYQAPARLLKPEAPEGEPPGGERPGGDLNDAVKYRAMVTSLDEAVGRLLAALRGNGLEKNTFVLFLSDNGPDPNPRLVGSAGPLRGSKHTLWEGGIRVPAIAWWPGRIPAGVVRRSYAISADFFATALALAGVNKPGDLTLDGRDIMPLLVSGAPGKSRDLYWSYIRDTLRISRERAVRRGKWKWLNGELYDLETDPGERRDLAARHPRLAAALETAWKTWVAQFPREARRWEGRSPQRAGEK